MSEFTESAFWAAAAVAVEVDALLGSTRCALAEVSGIELGVAPLRPPKTHTVERQVKFVPYGEQVRPMRRCADAVSVGLAALPLLFLLAAFAALKR